MVLSTEAAPYERGNPARCFPPLFLEPCLDALSLWSDVIISIKILPLLGRVRILAYEMSLERFFLTRLYLVQVASRLIRPTAGPRDLPRTSLGSNVPPSPLQGHNGKVHSIESCPLPGLSIRSLRFFELPT